MSWAGIANGDPIVRLHASSDSSPRRVEETGRSHWARNEDGEPKELFANDYRRNDLGSASSLGPQRNY